MERHLARIVKIDDVSQIPDADAIEVAQVGGWKVVVKKNEFFVGDLAVYFEIDSFLPEGNQAWQFLVDKSPRIYQEVRGHVLRSVKLRGQVSQGLLLHVNVLPEGFGFHLGSDVTEALGVIKYDPPVGADFSAGAKGPYPSVVPKTDQERIQNLKSELAGWAQAGLAWEVTEKLEGTSCTFMWMDAELRVCSRNLELLETAENTLWKMARELDLEEKFRSLAEAHPEMTDFAVQGELVGPGIQKNIYKLHKHEFRVYDIYNVNVGCHVLPLRRAVLVQELGLSHVPVLDIVYTNAETTMESLLNEADGWSQLNLTQLREGLVFKAAEINVSFKVISNKYLLKQKD